MIRRSLLLATFAFFTLTGYSGTSAGPALASAAVSIAPVADLASTALHTATLLGGAVLLFVVPGLALWTWLCQEIKLPWPSILAVSVGISLALYPVVLLWADLLGLHLGAWNAWLPVLLGLLALAWRFRRWRPHRVRTVLKSWTGSPELWPDLALILVVALSVGVRLLVVRDLPVAMWADSYQHTVIAQLFVDNGGLFQSWEPYAPYKSLTVHFGFHSLAAMLTWLTGLPTTGATVLAGQLANGFAIITLYPLAVRIARGNRWAGVVAVLVAGLLSPMPMEYVNWGRFPQVAGQAILPIALFLLCELVERGRFAKGLSVLAALSLAGMALTYYRMLFFYVTFVAVWAIGWGLTRWKSELRQWLDALTRLLAVACLALVLFLPWQRYMGQSLLVESVSEGISRGTPIEIVKEDYHVWTYVLTYAPWPLLALSGLSLLWSLYRRLWPVAMIVLWVAALASLVALRLLHVPAMNQMQNFALVIALYVPIALLIGCFAGDMIALLKDRISPELVFSAIAALSLFGFAQQNKVLQPSFALVTRADLDAMEWIQQNTDPSARFLIEAYLMYDGLVAGGSDAGLWIPLLAHRQNTMPPQYALVNEVPAKAGYSKRTIDLVAQLTKEGPTAHESLRLLCDAGVTHVYIGQQQGKAGPNTPQLFAPDAFLQGSAFKPVYQADKVWIFALDPADCSTGGG